MGVTSSMWTAVSGLLAHGEKMNVVGNNIANVNTMAFKSQRMDFEDFVYQDTTSANGFAQVGRGVSINAIMGDFSQGAQERSNTVTDLSINGNGFFKVRNPSSQDEVFYTRAGNYRFNKDGDLVDPGGNILQGWEIERVGNTLASSSASASPSSQIKGSGVPKDISLGTFTCFPQHSQRVAVLSSLNSATAEKSTNTDNPFFAMLLNWDASNPATQSPLGDSSFGHQTTFTVFDEGGNKHNLTVYFDRVTEQAGVQNFAGFPDATNVWEYIVTMDPLEDNRSFGPAGAETPVTNASRGLLMSGTLNFNTAGQLQNMSAFVPANDTTSPEDLKNLTNWVPAPLSNDGKPMFVANFSGIGGMSSVFDPGNPPALPASLAVNQSALPFMMEMDFGINSRAKSWTNTTTVTANDVKNVATRVPSLTNALVAAETVRETNGSSTSKTRQDGFGFGYLQNVLVGKDGVLSARYDNGVTLDLYQITLYDFINNQGLYREGGNMYTETRDSGSPTEGAAGSSGLGQVYSNSLEMSNVDLAQEFVYMIATQRGFQANSKTITTVDTMLEQVINMKR